MAEIETSVPTLTLEPNQASTVAQDMAAFADSTFQSVEEEKEKEAKREANAIQINEDMLTEQEKAAVNDFYTKIDIRDSNMVMQYGAAAQKNIANFSENALNNVRTKDLGEIGQDLASLVTELKTVGEVEKKGIAGFFRKKKA